MVGPGPKGAHYPRAFEPDSDWQADQVTAAWRADPNVQYLGDWHTHPHGTTHFSARDVQTARIIAGHEPAQQPYPVMLVLALQSDLSVLIAACRLIQTRLHPLNVAV